MSDVAKLKLFISWSGDLSRSVALALREWVPNLFDTVSPWVSDRDIPAGQRGLSQIESELQGTRFGIIVVTQENQSAPWLNFEAGAMSKVVDGDQEQRVAPLLVDISSPAQLTGPLSQFQAKVLHEDGMHELVRSIAEAAELPSAGVDARFAMFWPQLEDQVKQAIVKHSKPVEEVPKRSTEEMLEEALTHIRVIRADQTHMLNRMRPALGAPNSKSVFDANTVIYKRILNIASSMGVVVQLVRPAENGYAVVVTPDTDTNLAVNFEGTLDTDPMIRAYNIPVNVYTSEGAIDG